MLLTLDGLLSRQRAMQETVYGVKPQDLDGEDLAEYIRLNVLAATDELHEVLAETGWKPWKRSELGRINRQEFADEIVDVLAFVANLALAAGIDGHELTWRLVGKWHENERRQAEEPHEGS